MDNMIGHLPYMLVYLDDILVFSTIEEEHKTHLKAVLTSCTVTPTTLLCTCQLSSMRHSLADCLP